MRGLAAVLMSLLLVSPAAAHSLLLESSPAAGTTIGTAPGELSLRFNNRIEKRLSRIKLVDERGQAQDLVVATDGAADRLTAPLPAVRQGRYRVEWQVLSIDGHVVTGRYTFTIGP